MAQKPLILPVNEKSPSWGRNCFIAPNATLVGDVILGDNCTVWFGAIIRGDVSPIRIGHTSNIQDGVVIHGTFGKSETKIGNHVSIAHNAVVHGCTIEDGVLVGMNAVIMDNAIIGTGCVIAAGAVVLENTICEAGYIYAGMPAKKIKPVGEDVKERIRITPLNYTWYAKWFDSSINPLIKYD